MVKHLWPLQVSLRVDPLFFFWNNGSTRGLLQVLSNEHGSLRVDPF